MNGGMNTLSGPNQGKKDAHNQDQERDTLRKIERLNLENGRRDLGTK